MKRLYSLAVAMGTAVLASAQLTGLTVETVTVHDGSIPELEGYTTYRVYADLTSEFDFVSAVYGDDNAPLLIGCTDGSFFQSTPGGQAFDFGNQINPAFFGAFPELEYDSWFAIGAENSGAANSVDPVGEALTNGLDLFNQGDGFVVNDAFGGSWFNLFNCTGSADLATCAAGNPAFAGAENRVLLAQLTANGEVYGILNIQVFAGGDQSVLQESVGLSFSSDLTAVFGCTDDSADNYNALATLDDVSCTYPCTLELQESAAVAPTCNGENDGSLQVIATGAQGADYFFLDSIPGGAFDEPTAFGGQNFGNFADELSGEYVVWVFDGAGCTDSLLVEIPATEPVEIEIEIVEESCPGSNDAVVSIVSVSGGNGGDYTFYFSNDPEQVPTTQMEWTGLAGLQSYSVTAFDTLGCQGVSNVELVPAPTPIDVGLANASVSESVSDASCSYIADGMITLVAAGGTAPQTIQFSVDGENYGPSPLMVTAGTYEVTAQDVNGCIGTMEQLVVVGPDPIEINALSVAEDCVGFENGEVSWAPVGGNGNYTYSFEGAATTATMAESLAPGDYVISVTDGDNCVASDTVTVEEATPIAVSTAVTDASCFGEDDGEVVVTATGGVGNFEYSDNDVNYSENNVFGGFAAGTATLFVTDGNGCEAQAQATIDEPGAIVITPIISQNSPTDSATIDITVFGGQPPYSFEWSGPGVFGVDTPDLENISTGEYTLEVTDSLGCTAEGTYNVVTSILDLSGEMVAKVYPNPSVGMFTVDIEGGRFGGEVEYRIFDAQGRVMSAGQWVMTSGLFRASVDLTGAEAGMYRLVMLSNGHPSTVQLVKVN